MKKRLSTVRREFRNRDYTEDEVLVREATSNSEEMPSAALLDKIGKAMLRLPTYTDIFEILWRRLCHLEYRRHVFKALCVLDHLMRVNPPNSTVQLALVVDARDRWADISRLSALRLEALGSDTGQIRSLALRICQFVVEYENSPNFAVNRDRLRVKRKQTILDPREDGPVEEVGAKWTCATCGFANLSRLQNCIMCDHAKEPIVRASSPSPSSQWWWACARCSFVNTRAGFTNICEMCRSQRTVKIVGESPSSPHVEHKESPARPPKVSWQCNWCTFTNTRLTTEPCEACSKTAIQVLAEAEHDAANLKSLQQKLKDAMAEQESVEQTIRRLTQELVSAERKLKEAQEAQRRLSQQERETNEVRAACRKQAMEQARQVEARGVDIAQRARMEQLRRDQSREEEKAKQRADEARRQELDGLKAVRDRLELEKQKREQEALRASEPRSELEAIKQAAKERIANLKQKQESGGTWNCSFCHFSNPSSTVQCEVCKQTQVWVCSYCQTNNLNSALTCRQCNRAANSKLVIHYSNPPEETQPKGWLCPCCRTVNQPSAEICKTCLHRQDLAPPAYHPPSKEVHGVNQPFTVEHHPPSKEVHSVNQPFTVEHPPSSAKTSPFLPTRVTAPVQTPLASASPSTLSSHYTHAPSPVSPARAVKEEREPIEGISRQLSSLASFDAFFEEEEGSQRSDNSFHLEREPSNRSSSNSVPPAAGLWTCSQCAYINDQTNSLCDVCNEPRH